MTRRGTKLACDWCGIGNSIQVVPHCRDAANGEIVGGIHLCIESAMLSAPSNDRYSLQDHAGMEAKVGFPLRQVGMLLALCNVTDIRRERHAWEGRAP